MKKWTAAAIFLVACVIPAMAHGPKHKPWKFGRGYHPAYNQQYYYAPPRPVFVRPPVVWVPSYNSVIPFPYRTPLHPLKRNGFRQYRPAAPGYSHGIPHRSYGPSIGHFGRGR